MDPLLLLGAAIAALLLLGLTALTVGVDTRDGFGERER